ncbi:hypothetical protein HXA31_03415 [Salipaludibacillus agaradhaerens]|uniref:Uncharacterized protein n=1 Tax=Salipaludibacillus agaradhaerens TaxID=76935 RepID=A0A9Q4B2U9_SALAG|nr:hypothetical protein [Salipaludibacillus agaradhaerens]MCR6097115.1 hypothetical protein [Salipaludibacillus agaradhaerens]MCR6113400.1 hypothetical protein [Salipaludibacillus agaradhaerens]
MINKKTPWSYKWHRFLVLWHAAKADYYGSIKHEKRMLKHEELASKLLNEVNEKKRSKVQKDNDSSSRTEETNMSSLETSHSTK